MTQPHTRRLLEPTQLALVVSLHAMSNSYLSAQQQREQLCSDRSRNTMFAWFAGGAAVFGGSTYLAHLYCQPTTNTITLTQQRTAALGPARSLTSSRLWYCTACVVGAGRPACNSTQLPLQSDPGVQSADPPTAHQPYSQPQSASTSFSLAVRSLLRCCVVLRCVCAVATLALAYLRGEQELNNCRREQMQLEFLEDRKERTAAWHARKQQIATQQQLTPRSAHQTVHPSNELPTSPAALGAARNDGTYDRSQSKATHDQPGK